jgi:hypothetical protein
MFTSFSLRRERTRISCHDALDKAACAPCYAERRVKIAEPLNSTGNPGDGLGLAIGEAHRHYTNFINARVSVGQRAVLLLGQVYVPVFGKLLGHIQVFGEDLGAFQGDVFYCEILTV